MSIKYPNADETSKILQEIRDNKEGAKKHIGLLEEKLMSVIDSMDKIKVDARNPFVLDNKIKTVSSFFDTILKYKKFVKDISMDELNIVNGKISETAISEEEIKDIIEKVLNKSVQPDIINQSEIIIPEINIEFEGDNNVEE